jgi:hypothetical protein
MAKLRINGDSSGYVDLEAPNAASSSTLDLDQVPQKNVANVFTTHQVIRTDTASGGYTAYPSLTLRNDNVNGYSVLHFNRGATTQSARIEVDNNNGSPTIGMYATSAGNGIKVDHNGVVTKPNQPAFFAHRNGGNYTETTATAKVYIDGTRFNHGGHYDTTNNRFVAPVDGVYQFNASVNCYYISSGYQLRAFLYVNGSNYVVGDSFHSANNAHDLVASVSHVINLSANDYVEVWSFSDDGSRGFSSSVIWNTFSGYLIG